jgi:hypothetical protein
MKVIAGLGCLVEALPLGFLALGLFSNRFLRVSAGVFAFVPAIFALGLVALGVFLILKRDSVLSKKAKVLLAVFMGIFVAGPVILDIHIRHERRLLQLRAKAFLSRPLPKLLIPDAEGNVGGRYVDTNSGPQNGVLGFSRVLIERYANTGRIRWSARIQGQFADTGDGVNFNYQSDAIKTNEEVNLYLAERNAILGKEWQMGFWQLVEDVMEMKMPPPEFEEENAKPATPTNSASVQQ